jgi:phage tail protein X
MPKSSQSAEEQLNRQHRPQHRPETTPEQTVEQTIEQTTVVDTPSPQLSFGANGANGIQNQAANLNNRRIPTLQRQMMANRMAQTHGNLHMQQVLAATSHQRPVTARSTNQPDNALSGEQEGDSESGLGSGGQPTLAPVSPPPPNGNSNGVIQPKLTVSEPGDPYEEEADQVAQAVMRMPAPPPVDGPDTTATPEAGHKGNGTVQRRGVSEGENDDLPTEEEKAEALANAEAARAEAASVKTEGENKAAESQSQAESQKSEAEGAKQEVAASQAQGPVTNPGAQAEQAATEQSTAQTAQTQEAQSAAEQQVAEAAGQVEGGSPGSETSGELASSSGEGGGGGGSGAAPEDATAEAQNSLEEAISDAESAPDKAPEGPEEDSAYQGVSSGIGAVGQQSSSHGPAQGEAAEAQAAAQSPESELEGKAQSNQVGQMEQTETPGFDAAAFKAQLMQRIAELTPSTAEEADEFKEDGKLDGVKGEMQGQVEQERQASQGPLEEKTAEAPDTGSVEGKPVTPLTPGDPGAPPPDLGGEQAVPKPKGTGEVETPMQQSSQALDQQMADAKITDEQLANSNEPEFQAALDSKQEAQTSAQEAPSTYREEEQAQLSQAEAEAAGMTQTQTQAMHDERTGLLGQVDQEQQQTVSEDEQKRREIAAKINAIYARTKTDVEAILSGLDAKVNAAFDAGAQAAKQAFEDYVDREVEAYKEERYGGMFGWAKWLADKVLGMPSEINQIYAQGRTNYLAAMDKVIDEVVAIIAKELAEAKARIAQGKQEIQDFVDQQPEELRDIAAQAAQDIQGRFDELEQMVDAKQGELIDSLANKYQENLQAVDARIEEMKEANKGLVQKAIDAVGGAIQAIIELKDMLLGVLARAAGVIEQIIRDPIGFVGNLVDGVSAGFDQFVDNIWDHLQEGFISWLTGAIGEAGLTLPENFDLPGIFQLVLDILDLSFEDIMRRVTDLLGFDVMAFVDPIMEVIAIYQEEGLAGLARYGLAQLIGEDGVEGLMEILNIVQVIMDGNFGALWTIVSEYLTDLQDVVFDGIKEFLIEKVVKAGITWILGMLNPAGAFIKACMAIYDIVMFFIERGSQIMSLVNAVIDSISAIVGGNISAMANAIENALARAIPVAIGFLASLLGLGGIGEKVKEVVEKVRGLVDKALDAIFESGPVQAVAGLVKTVIDKVKGFVEAGIDKGKQMLGMGGDDEEEEPGASGGEAETESGEANGPAVDAAIQQAQQSYLNEEGQITEEEAQQTANTVQQQFPALSSITVADGGDSWKYVARMATKKEEAPQMVLEDLEERARDLLNRTHKIEAELHANNPTAHAEHRSMLIDATAAAERILDQVRSTTNMTKADANLLYDDLMEFEGKVYELEEELAGLPEHQDTKHVEIEDNQYILKEPYRKKVREKFYGSGYRTDVTGWKEELLTTPHGQATPGGYQGICDPTDPNKYFWGGQYWENSGNTIATIEHGDPAVVVHWNDQGGNDTSQGERRDFYNEISGMEIMPKSENSSLGAQMADRYTPNVGPDFRGPG